MKVINPNNRDVETSYDLVADEYARGLFLELEHKPLDLAITFTPTQPPPA